MSEPKVTPEVARAVAKLQAMISATGHGHNVDDEEIAVVVLQSLLPPSDAMIEAAAKAYAKHNGAVPDDVVPALRNCVGNIVSAAIRAALGGNE